MNARDLIAAMLVLALTAPASAKPPTPSTTPPPCAEEVVAPPRARPRLRDDPITRRDVRRGRFRLGFGILTLEAGVLVAAFGALVANPLCFSFDLDGYDDPSATCPSGDIGAGVALGVAGGFVAAVGVGLMTSGGIRIHRARRDGRARLSSSIAFAPMDPRLAPMTATYSLHF